jgi:REJ domain
MTSILLPAYTLDPSVTYTINLLVYDTKSLISTYSKQKVVVEVGKVTSMIRGGSFHFVNSQTVYTFDGSLSFDGDLPPGDDRSNGLRYLWHCAEMYPDSSLECPVDLQGGTSAVATVVTANMVEGTVVELSLEVSNEDGSRSDVSRVRLQVNPF